MQLQLNIKPVFIAGLWLLTIQAMAQEIPSRPNEGIRRTETKREQYNGYQDLKLSEDQKNRMTVLQKEGKAAFAAIRNDQSLTRDGKKEKLQALQQELTRKRNAILTPGQQKIWEQEFGKRKSKKDSMITVDQRHTATAGNRDHNALPQMAGKSILTAAQQQKMKELAGEYREQAGAIRQDNTLSADEKKSRMEALRKELRKKGKTILTKEQWQQWAKQDRNRKNNFKQ